MLYIVVTESSWLLLERAKDENLGTLLVWATLHTLARLEHDLDMPNLLAFHWYKGGKTVI